MRLNNELGEKGENIACEFLRRKGFTIIERNSHCRFGEIDIIAEKRNLLIFVEVKYRSGKNFGGAAYSITASKAQKMRLSIELWLQKHPHRGQCRADAILIEGENPPQHIENILE